MLIAFCGKIGSGKTESAKYLADDYGFVRRSFAHELKRIAINNFGWNGRKDKKGREFLQELGLLARNYNEHFWINKLEENTDWSKDVVLDDCRFKNEANWVKNKNGILIKVERKLHIKSKHISETELDKYKKFDYAIDNNYRLEELYKQIDLIMEDIFSSYYEE